MGASLAKVGTPVARWRRPGAILANVYSLHRCMRKIYAGLGTRRNGWSEVCVIKRRIKTSKMRETEAERVNETLQERVKDACKEVKKGKGVANPLDDVFAFTSAKVPKPTTTF